ncbi:MAG: ABC transporter ATP-binding protein [Pseudomonadota bacterium]|nr:ABC transporter ATP-binding protein [Pseudomonadota bacterium]
MADIAIRVNQLTKRFGEIIAVNEISFFVRQGKICALLGGNGAGKTTTISMLLGLLIPSAGKIEILGTDMIRDRYKVLPRINFSSPYVDLPKRLTSRENLMVYSKLYGISDPKGRIVELASDLDIGRFLDRPFGELSSGQKTRVSLAKSLLNQPDLLLLDEPTASLDPDTADWVRTYLMELQQDRDITILLASHNMSEVERMCDDVVMMKEGSIVDRETPAALLTKYGRANLEDVFLDIARGRGNGERPKIEGSA